jgi:lipoprotein-anchoring transpeptidase ErfK/SrfK
MRHRSFILVVCFLLALFGGAAGLYAHDRSSRDTIADGVRVGGVSVGGLTAGDAKAKLDRRLLQPLRTPVAVHHGDRVWRLGPRESRVAVNVDATVEQALARSRRGNMFTRTWREINGGRVAADLEPTVSYSRPAVARLVDRIRVEVRREPKDASLSFAAGGVRQVRGHAGAALDSKRLRREVRAALASRDADRDFDAHVRTLRPKTTTAELADKYRTLLLVNRGAFKLTLYKRLKAVKTYGIAVGKVGLETPRGLYNVQNKAIDPAWHVPNSAWAGELAGKVIPGGTAENPIKARWMGIFAGAGIHGTSEEGSIGSAASHGCIRMRIAEVKQLYPQVDVGTPVYID